jgi:hypothetical protein
VRPFFPLKRPAEVSQCPQVCSFRRTVSPAGFSRAKPSARCSTVDARHVAASAKLRGVPLPSAGRRPFLVVVVARTVRASSRVARRRSGTWPSCGACGDGECRESALAELVARLGPAPAGRGVVRWSVLLPARPAPAPSAVRSCTAAGPAPAATCTADRNAARATNCRCSPQTWRPAACQTAAAAAPAVGRARAELRPDLRRARSCASQAGSSSQAQACPACASEAPEAEASDAAEACAEGKAAAGARRARAVARARSHRAPCRALRFPRRVADSAATSTASRQRAAEASTNAAATHQTGGRTP